MQFDPIRSNLMLFELYGEVLGQLLRISAETRLAIR